MPAPVQPTPEHLHQAAELLESGKVVAFPTETVYGLGANAWSDDAVRSIYAIKGRPSHNPLIAHIASLDQLSLVTTPETVSTLQPILSELKSFIPGPLSLVMKRNNRICDTVSAGLETVAVRIPEHQVAQQLLRLCAFPLAAPSANPSNYISPTEASHVEKQLGDKVAMILDGGSCRIGIESTILDLSVSPARILRQGKVTVEQLSDALNLSPETLLRASTDPQEPVSAPGMLREHYAPLTRTMLLNSGQTRFEDRTGLIYFNRQRRPELSHPFIREEALSDCGDLEQAAYNLFRVMREFDTLKLDLIVIEGCTTEGIGRAIMDRLTRACARSNRE